MSDPTESDRAKTETARDAARRWLKGFYAPGIVPVATLGRLTARIEARDAQARAEGRRQMREEAARWHDAEAERIRKMLESPRSVGMDHELLSAIGDHESHATFIREIPI